MKLTNAKDLVKRGLVAEGEDPLKVAADRLVADGVDVLHTIGGDDTNTTAADLAAYLAEHDYGLTVVGLPKTIDNDVIPIRQSLGADTAAEMGARFAKNVVAEHNAGTRILIIHEVMGRNCGWLTAATARKYHEWVDSVEWLPEIGLSQGRLGRARDLRPRGRHRPRGRGRPPAEGDGRGRLRRTSSSPRAPGIDDIVAEMEKAGPGGGPRRVRPHPPRADQPRRLVRQAVRRTC